MKYVLVGTSFFGALAILFYLTIIEKENTNKLFPYKMKLYYQRAEGIKPGTEITVLGIPFGKVESIRQAKRNEFPDDRYLEDGKEEGVELTLMMKQPLTLWDNYSIKFKAKTAFSGRSIDIDPGNFKGEESSSFTPSYARGANPSDHSPIARYYDDFFSSAYEVLDENKKDFRKIVVNLKETSYKLNSGKGTLPMFIHSDIAYNNIYDLSSDASLTLREARRYTEGERHLNLFNAPFVLTVYLNILGLNILSQSTGGGQ
ncbi:MAG: MCE family protein [Leptospiraceae bacterium]|nr:MCE family protein [Leptospiraceae bacterium]